MEKRVKNVIKGYEKLSKEELEDFLDYLKVDENEDDKSKVEEKKEEVKKEEKTEEKSFVTSEQLNEILTKVLGKVAFKEDVEKLQIEKKKAKEFGADGKTIVNETDDRDNRLAKILSDLNA